MFYGIVIRRFASQINSLPISKIFHLKPYNERLKIMGWLKSHRRFKERSFLQVDDGSTLQRLQVVVPKALCPKTLGYHTCLSVEGRLVESIGTKQSMELVADEIKVVNCGAPSDYPFTEKGTYLEEDLRQVPHYRVRTRQFSSLLRLRSQAKKAIQNYFENENFINVDTPILTRNRCEGGNVFTIKGDQEDGGSGPGYFGSPVYLSISGQLHLEAMVSGLQKVYNFNPAFRREKGTSHLHEFWMIEAEEAFLEQREGFERLIDRLEAVVKAALSDLLRYSGEDLEFLWRTHGKEAQLQKSIPRYLETPFVRLTFREALEILKANEHKLEKPLAASCLDLNRERELFLTRFCGDVPVFVTDWPAASKPFYMYTEDQGDQEIAYGVDLLMPLAGEVAGGSLREHRLERLRTKVAAMAPDGQLEWYVQLRRFGHPPSGGFGMGFERLLQALTGVPNIRDAIPFQRANGQCIS